MNEILKQIDCGEVAVIAGITVVSTGICILCPPATPWVIAGGVAAGALAEGGMEVYKESKTGEYDWVKILTKTLGGGLKGALAASPLKPLATGVGVATTGAIEDYIYCIANGETHEQALKSAAINGPIEGLTAGGCKWLGNAVKAKKLQESVSKPIPVQLKSTHGVGVNVSGETSKIVSESSKMVRVGRWMCRAEYDKMIESGKVQMSADNKVHVANPANIGAFEKQASKGSIYVEFDVPSNTISKGGKEGWGVINGPGSLYDRLNAHKGLPRITEMPSFKNIEIKGSK